MTDPISTYRNVCSNAQLSIRGGSNQQCASAAVDMVQAAIDGLNHHSMDAAAARQVWNAGHAAFPHVPPEMQGKLGSLLSQLDSAIAALEQARTGRQDHVAPAPRPTARAASPAATVTAGIRPELAGLRGSSLRAQIQRALFADRAQTTRTLGALASISPAALRALVTARVGRYDADAVLEALGDNAQMQMRVRISERADASLMRGAERLEQGSTGSGLTAAVGQLLGPQREPVLATLRTLGADTEELRTLIVEGNHNELRRIVADTLRGGATQMRELAQRYDAAHNVLDGSGEFYRLFPESVRQVGAQLGMPADLTRSALGSFVREDIAAAAHNEAVNGVFVALAGLALAFATGGSGLIGGLAVAGIRVSGDAGVALQHADEMGVSASAGETTAEFAAAARSDARWETGTAIAGALVGAGVGVVVENGAPALGHAAGPLVERAAEELVTIAADEVRDLQAEHARQ